MAGRNSVSVHVKSHNQFVKCNVHATEENVNLFAIHLHHQNVAETWNATVKKDIHDTLIIQECITVLYIL